ncbi:Acetyltransferase [Aureococcus anophagefferens]|nr:Acetyltransferase [Aureococcus anophagefferens]
MGAAITTATLVIGLSASCGAFSSTAQPRPPTALRAKKADRRWRRRPRARRTALLSVGDGARRGHGRGAARLALAVAAASAYAGDADAALAAVVLACCYREVAFFGLEYKVEAAVARRSSPPPFAPGAARQAVDAGAAAAYALLAVAKRPRDRAERTVDVREAVLWPGRRDMCVLASDGDGTHFGAFFPAADNERPVGVISLFWKETRRRSASSPCSRTSGAAASAARCSPPARPPPRTAARRPSPAAREQAIAFYEALRRRRRALQSAQERRVRVRMRKPLAASWINARRG